MKTIYKYEMLPKMELTMPVEAHFLHAGEQNNGIYLWFQVNTAYPNVTKIYKAYPTGAEMSVKDEEFLATVQMKNGLVFHIYCLGVKNEEVL